MVYVVSLPPLHLLPAGLTSPLGLALLRHGRKLLRAELCRCYRPQRPSQGSQLVFSIKSAAFNMLPSTYYPHYITLNITHVFPLQAVAELDAAASAEGASEELHSFLAAALSRRLRDEDPGVLLAVLQSAVLLRLPAAPLCDALEELLAALPARAAALSGKPRMAVWALTKEVRLARPSVLTKSLRSVLVGFRV